MRVEKILQNFILVERVEEVNRSEIILPECAQRHARTAFVRVLKTHEEYVSYGHEVPCQVKEGDLCMVMCSLDGNISFTVNENTEAFLVPANAVIAVVSEMDLIQDAEVKDENSIIDS